MNLHELLTRRANSAGPVKVGVIGVGKFASMFLTQALHVPEIHVVAVADLDVGKARAALARAGWPAERYQAGSFAEALRAGGTYVSDSADDLIAAPGLEALLEVTGNPVAGARHADLGIDAGLHVIMVNVEADCLVGPVLATRPAWSRRMRDCGSRRLTWMTSRPRSARRRPAANSAAGGPWR